MNPDCYTRCSLGTTKKRTRYSWCSEVIKSLKFILQIQTLQTEQTLTYNNIKHTHIKNELMIGN